MAPVLHLAQSRHRQRSLPAGPRGRLRYVSGARPGTEDIRSGRVASPTARGGRNLTPAAPVFEHQARQERQSGVHDAAPGRAQFFDGGRLDLGVVRDSTLDATNDYEMFVEPFEGLADRGIESLQIQSTILPSGASAGTVAPSSYTQ